MTTQQFIDAIEDYPSNMELRVEFGIDHHVSIERVDEHHPEGAVGTTENYLLLILE